MSNNPNTASSDPVLLMEHACLDFGDGDGVFDLNMALPRGAILGMIGPSGCGKTTTIRLLNGVYGATSGTVRVFGQDPLKFSQADKARLGYIPQHFILYPNLNVEENMHFIGGIYGMKPAQCTAKMRPLLEFVNLTEARKRLARNLSGGMQRRLALVGALLHDPDLLMADEPTAGIDPILRARIWENFRQLRDEGKTLLVTTQYVGEAAYCDQVAVMSKGRLITMDTPTGLQHQAMGGEVIHLQVEASRLAQCRHLVDDLPQVRDVQLVDQEPDGLYVFVDDAGQQLPIVLSLLGEQLDLTPRVAEPYTPPFDEVFVRLIQSADHRRQAEVQA